MHTRRLHETFLAAVVVLLILGVATLMSVTDDALSAEERSSAPGWLFLALAFAAGLAAYATRDDPSSDPADAV